MASVFLRDLKDGKVWIAKLLHPQRGWVQYNTTLPASTKKRIVEQTAWKLQEALDAFGKGLRDDPIAADKKRAVPVATSGDLDRLCDEFLSVKAKMIKPETLYLHRHTLQEFRKLGGVTRVRDITRQTIDNFIQKLYERGVENVNGKRLRNLSAHTANIHRRNLKVWMNWMVEEEKVSGWTMPRIRQEKAPAQGQPDYWSPDECEIFLRAALKSKYYLGSNGSRRRLPKAEPVAPFFLLIMATGMRLGETLALRWSMIVERKCEIRLPGKITKGSKPATIPIPDYALAAILTRKTLGTELVFDQWLKNGIRDVFNEIVETEGLPKIKLHNLRDSYAQNHIDEGVPLHVISAILRHSSVLTTSRNYLFVGIDEMRRGLTRQQERGTYEAALQRGYGANLVPNAGNYCNTGK